ncbi:SDR family oxidoreductase [Kineobactrum salinum]|uniref:SDR family oxidoreductase n=1 Tax=Kineobactrum salinum TaxID=2708301 RepID=A0A6C0U4N7_9GAMM|nr:SDR family oxidoreductase [Kineobactrum salinum]QIB66813.1 SDR family oxidoreductase [Kineobactrum salinum]
MTNVAGRTAFITGGANGIGLGIARAFAGAGAKLALVDIDEDALSTAKDELAEITDVYVATLDVRDREAYGNVAKDLKESLGDVSILVNNAGVGCDIPLENLNFDIWDWGVGINFNGVYNGIHTFVPGMIARGDGGHVINTASGAGLVASNVGVLYHATKFGIVGMSEAMQIELKRYDIGVTVLCPGPVTTGIMDRSKEFRPKINGEFSSEQLERVSKRFNNMSEFLKQGKSPGEVGAMLLKAVSENCLYLHTDSTIKGLVTARHKAIMDSMPD